MNITLNGTKITQDTRNLAFEKNNNVDEIVITVDTDESWSYKLDVKYPDKYNVENDTLYNIIDLDRNGNICSATLTRGMLPFNGKYTMQLRGINGDKVYHSDTFEVWVKYSIEPGSTYDPVPSEFYQIEARLDDKVDEAKQYAEIASTRLPKISPNNTWLIWDVDTGDYVDTGIKASGADNNLDTVVSQLIDDVDKQKNDLANKVPKTDYAPELKTDAMTQPVGKDEDGKLWTAPTGGGSSGGSSVAIDDTLTVSGAAADAKTVGALFDAIRGEMDNLHPLEIKSFTVYPDIVEKGSTVTAQVFSYSVNRTSAETKIDGTAVTGGSASRSDALSEDKTYTLTATLKDVTKTKTASIRFVAPIYYGVGESYTLENETVLSLNRLLKTSKTLTFTVNAASGQYILFAIPVSMGTPTFNVGGFEGGFTLAGTFEFTNSSGHSEDYRLYRSVNSGLGSTKVSVS